MPTSNAADSDSFGTGSVEETREAFLIDLASFELLLKKGRAICEAERRQVNEYKRESARIGFYPVAILSFRVLNVFVVTGREHEAMRSEIERLKIALEEAQTERRRKIEYDQVAEKINTLPTRQELELFVFFFALPFSFF